MGRSSSTFPARSSAPWFPFELIVRLRPSVRAAEPHHLDQVDRHQEVTLSATSSRLAANVSCITITSISSISHEGRRQAGSSGDRRAIQGQIEHSAARTAKDLRCRGNTWFIPYDTVQSKAEKFHHPSTFPLALPQWCIRLHGRIEGCRWIRSWVRARQWWRPQLEEASGIGIDMDPAYVAIAQRRLAEAGDVRRIPDGL